MPTPHDSRDHDAEACSSPSDKMHASPARLRSFAERLAAEGDAEMAEQVRRAADEIDAARESKD